MQEEKLTNAALWNEAGKSGLPVGGLSVLCLALKESATLTGSALVVQVAAFVLWGIEFFGCIWLVRRQLMRLRASYPEVTYPELLRFGRRMALFSGLLLAGASAWFTLQMPQETLNEMLDAVVAQLGTGMRDQAGSVLDHLPLIMFCSQWLYCYLYGTVLSAILSRNILLSNPF